VQRDPFLYDVADRAERRRASLARARRFVWARRALVAVLVCVAAAGTALAIASRSDGGFHRGSVRFSACQVDLVAADCGRLSVPEDPRRPGGPTISLRIAVIPAARQPAKGALFYFAGGPGGAASADVPIVDQLFGAVAAERDLVLVDQRGTGGSNPLTCPPTSVPVARTLAVAQYVRRCFQRLGPRVRLYTTAIAAADVEAVRRALRYGPVDLYGASYGATAAQVYLRRFPDSVRSVVLDSGSLLDVPVYARLAANGEHALALQLARCRAQPACRRAYPRPRADLAALLRRGPRRVVAFAGPVLIDANAVASTVQALSRASDLAPLVPQVVHQAALGDYQPLAQQYVSVVGAGLDPRARLAMSFEILCSEPWARFGRAGAAAGSYLSGLLAARARLFAQACRYVPKGVVPAGSERPVPTHVPALLLAGGADPQDPPANLVGWRTLFPDGRLVVVAGATHGVLEQGCLPVVVAQFVAAGTARGLDTSCVRRIGQPPFVIG
jgi:pimeloyl-ACP methyl ester carboxylesterase